VTTGPEDKFLGLDLSTHLLPAYRKQLSAWTANGTCIALLVYDLLPLSRPEWFSARAVNSFRKWFEILKNDAHLAICISNEVAADFQRRVESKQGRGPLIGTIRMGADIAASLPSIGLSPHARQFLERTRFRDYVLMVGTVEPRKGYHFALQVFEHLWRKSPNSAPDLVIAGKAGWKTGHLQQALRSHPQRGKRLHWLQDASDEALCRLYRGCSGVFVASYGEGFGLPLVEAAMFKKPVLARSLGVFCEHGLGNVSFFHDDSIDLVGDLLMQLGKRECRIDRTTLPTWNTCVDDLLSQLLIENKNRNEPGLPLRAAL
jgi:glycosyltransferase involved in cell wall biosynthesis